MHARCDAGSHGKRNVRIHVTSLATKSRAGYGSMGLPITSRRNARNAALAPSAFRLGAGEAKTIDGDDSSFLIGPIGPSTLRSRWGYRAGGHERRDGPAAIYALTARRREPNRCALAG